MTIILRIQTILDSRCSDMWGEKRRNLRKLDARAASKKFAKALSDPENAEYKLVCPSTDKEEIKVSSAVGTCSCSCHSSIHCGFLHVHGSEAPHSQPALWCLEGLSLNASSTYKYCGWPEAFLRSMHRVVLRRIKVAEVPYIWGHRHGLFEYFWPPTICYDRHWWLRNL